MELKKQTVDLLSGLTEQQKQTIMEDIYRFKLYQYTLEDVKGWLTENKNLSKEDFDTVAVEVASAYTQNGDYDCNLSYWQNIENLVEETMIYRGIDEIVEGFSFSVSAFYDESLCGLADCKNGLTYDEMVDYVHEQVSKGNFMEIVCSETGVRKVTCYDDYFKNFEGEFPFDLNDFEEPEQEMDR